MRIISVALFATTILILMTGAASATIVEQKLGQYDVTFDLTNTSMELNSSASKWNDSQDDGWIYVDLKNKPGTSFAEISIVHSNSGIVVYSPGYAENLQESGWKNVQTYTRTIDGNKDAILTTGVGPNGNHIYWASYKPNRNTLVEIKSLMPLDKGTGNLLNTIHVENLQEYITPINESDPVYWHNKGITFDVQGKYEEAIQAYNKAIELNQSYAEAWLDKASALSQLGKLDEAIKACDKAIEIKPRAIAWFNKGAIFQKLGKLDEAIKAYDKAIEINPRDEGAWFNKGSALRHQGKYDEAIKVYKKETELFSGNTLAWNFMALALKKLGRNSEAKAAFDKEGDILYDQRNYAEAIQAYDNATELDPQYAIPWYNKGNALAKQDKYDEAIKAYDEAIRLDPNFASAWSVKGNTLAQIGKYDDAAKANDEAHKIDPKNYSSMSATEFRNKYGSTLSIPVSTSGINYNDLMGIRTTASGMCHIIVDRAVGFSDEIDLDQYNTLPDDEAVTLLAERLDGHEAIIFTTGDTGSIDDHDALKGMTQIWTTQGGYWVNNDTITCEG